MSEQWREELQQYAYLLNAVAKGDRSMVVKLLADYLLANRDGDAHNSFEDTELLEWQNGSDLQHYYDDPGESDGVSVPRKRVRFADVNGNEAEEEEGRYEEEHLSYGDSHRYHDYQDQPDRYSGSYSTDFEDQNYDERAAWDDPYTTERFEEAPSQSNVDYSAVYDDPYHSQENRIPNADEVNPLALDSRHHYMPDFYVSGHTSRHFPSETEEYDPYYSDYYEDESDANYTSGQLGSESV